MDVLSWNIEAQCSTGGVEQLTSVSVQVVVGAAVTVTK